MTGKREPQKGRGFFLREISTEYLEDKESTTRLGLRVNSVIDSARYSEFCLKIQSQIPVFGACWQGGIKNYISVWGRVLVAPPSGLVVEGTCHVVHTWAHGPQGLEVGYGLQTSATQLPTSLQLRLSLLPFLSASLLQPVFWTL